MALTLTGYVFDNSGNAIPEATVQGYVSADDQTSGTTAGDSVTTDANGKWTITTSTATQIPMDVRITYGSNVRWIKAGDKLNVTDLTVTGALTVGEDDTGFDVKLYGATSGSFMFWDESEDALKLTDTTLLKIGDGSDMTLYHNGSDSYITNATGALNVATQNSGIAVTIGHTTSEVTIADNLTVTGNATLNGNVTLGSAADDVITINGTVSGASAVIFEGTASVSETSLDVVNPTADATIKLPAMSAGTYFLPVLDTVSTTAISSTPEELNLLDGVSGLVQADFTKLAALDATAAELNLTDGGSTVGTTAVSDGHGIVMNHGGTMAQTTVQTLAAYLDDEITAMPNLVTTAATTVGALQAGSITSGFTSIDVGSGAITTTGALSLGTMGSNWTNASRTVADMGIVTTIDINGGTIDGTTVGATGHSTIKGTTIDATTDFTIGATVITDGVITDASGLSLDADVTVTGDLIVNGDTVTVNTATLSVEDPLIALATGNGADSVDVGLYAKYTDSGVKYSGLFRDASDSDKWKLFATTGGSHAAPTTTVNTTSGFTLGTLVASAFEGDLTGDVTGNADTVTTNANLTGDVTSSGNATTIAAGVIIDNDVNASAAIAYSKLAALASGNILVGNGSNVAVSVNPSGDVDISNAGAFSIASGVIVNDDVNASAAIAVSKTALSAGTNISLSTNTLNVDDAFLINSGDDTTAGVVTAAGFTVGAMALTNGVITDASGLSIAAAVDLGSNTLGTSGVITAGGFTIGSAAILEAELEILDGATVTTTELNLLDGDTSVGGSITLADGDGFVINDGGTMKTIPATDLATYIESEGSMSSFQLEDSSGDEVTINNAKEIKMDGTGITVNWTDVSTGSDGDPFDLDFSIDDDAITLAKMASGTDGNIISYDASGNPVAVATGTDGQVLTSAGAGAPPAFEDAGGGTFDSLYQAMVDGNAASNAVKGFNILDAPEGGMDNGDKVSGAEVVRDGYGASAADDFSTLQGDGWRFADSSSNSADSDVGLAGNWLAHNSVTGGVLMARIVWAHHADLSGSCFARKNTGDAGGDENNFQGFRKITTGNVFAVCDSGGTETTRDVGTTGVLQVGYRIEQFWESGAKVMRFYAAGSQVGADVTTNTHATAMRWFLGLRSDSNGNNRCVMNASDIAMWRKENV